MTTKNRQSRSKTFTKTINGFQFFFTLTKVRHDTFDNGHRWMSRWYWGLVNDSVSSKTCLSSSAIRSELPYMVEYALKYE